LAKLLGNSCKIGQFCVSEIFSAFYCSMQPALNLMFSHIPL
jgi:hypothetical protein